MTIFLSLLSGVINNVYAITLKAYIATLDTFAFPSRLNKYYHKVLS